MIYHKFKELYLELEKNNLDVYNVRLDNVLSGQYINIFSTRDEVLAREFYKDLHDVLVKHQEK